MFYLYFVRSLVKKCYTPLVYTVPYTHHFSYNFEMQLTHDLISLHRSLYNFQRVVFVLPFLSTNWREWICILLNYLFRLCCCFCCNLLHLTIIRFWNTRDCWRNFLHKTWVQVKSCIFSVFNIFYRFKFFPVVTVWYWCTQVM